MPETVADGRAATRSAGPLIVIAVLAAMSLTVAFLGASPAPVSARELMGGARDPGQPAFVASHRGDADSAPENTLPGVLAALAAGFDYVEVDVALTADGAAVLMHDATVDRTTNGSGRLGDLPLAYVRSLDAGGWFGAAFVGTPVPLVEEFLDVLAASESRALIELKGKWTPVAMAHLVAEIETRGLERRVAVSSFDARTLAVVATESEVISRLAILRSLPDDVVQAARALGVRGVVAKGSAVIARPEIVDELHAAGLRVVVYTFNKDREWRDAIDLGVDGIVTDRPERLATWLASS
ncbi:MULTISPECIES: glycerophosphodiester phosphodiesterase [Bacteria]|jgi:glycerophosphoryl diester phosphodiesterase